MRLQAQIYDPVEWVVYHDAVPHAKEAFLGLGMLNLRNPHEKTMRQVHFESKGIEERTFFADKQLVETKQFSANWTLSDYTVRHLIDVTTDCEVTLVAHKKEDSYEVMSFQSDPGAMLVLVKKFDHKLVHVMGSVSMRQKIICVSPECLAASSRDSHQLLLLEIRSIQLGYRSHHPETGMLHDDQKPLPGGNSPGQRCFQDS